LRAAVFGGDAGGRDRDLLDRLEVEVLAEGAGRDVGRIDAVEEIEVVAGKRAV
jgi:hypothetical protein